MKFKLLSNLQDIEVSQWNALTEKQYPFLNYHFLRAMETHQCVGPDHGWIPRHLICTDDSDRLLGVLPMYEKHNSWGEFVFDYAWADAFHRAGIQYYPKLVNAIPFTPATGPRFLARDEDRDRISGLLVKAARQVMNQGEFSGMHSLFLNDDDYHQLSSELTVTRIDCQFHWYNQNYESFEQFLTTLKSRKRKKIRQERRRVDEAGIEIKRLNGHTASPQDWSDFTSLYRQIYDRKYGQPAFNLPFFMDIAETMPDRILLVMAKKEGQNIAAALMYHDEDTLYGRHWGCRQYIDCLHFELCYYQGIEFCIENQIKVFDPGAQGEHKIARGFLPRKTRSLHWMAKSPFVEAIREFVDHERLGVTNYIRAAQNHSPYLESA